MGLTGDFGAAIHWLEVGDATVLYDWVPYLCVVLYTFMHLQKNLDAFIYLH